MTMDKHKCRKCFPLSFFRNDVEFTPGILPKVSESHGSAQYGPMHRVSHFPQARDHPVRAMEIHHFLQGKPRHHGPFPVAVSIAIEGNPWRLGKMLQPQRGQHGSTVAGVKRCQAQVDKGNGRLLNLLGHGLIVILRCPTTITSHYTIGYEAPSPPRKVLTFLQLSINCKPRCNNLQSSASFQ